MRVHGAHWDISSGSVGSNSISAFVTQTKKIKIYKQIKQILFKSHSSKLNQNWQN